MKHLFLFLTTLFSCVVCQAQQYKVYSVVGMVTANEKQIQRGMLINGNCPIVIFENSKIILLDESAKEMITLSSPISGQLKNLIGSTTSRKKLTDSFFQYILKKMTKDDSPRDINVMQSSASSYREGDTLVLQTLLLQDTMSEKSIKN